MLNQKQAIICFLVQSQGLINVNIEAETAGDYFNVIKKYLPGLRTKGVAEGNRIIGDNLCSKFYEWKNVHIQEYEEILELEEVDLLLRLF